MSDKRCLETSPTPYERIGTRCLFPQSERTTGDRIPRRASQPSVETFYHDRGPGVTRKKEEYGQRAFKKSSQNGKLTLYLANRDLVVTAGKIDKLHGVLLIDPEFLQNKKVYGQVTLTFRYGREDEEVMGLKFCNEAVMSLAQLYPSYHSADRQESTTQFQRTLMERFHPNAHPFTMSVTPLAPPSVQLVPAKEYNGAPIGTSYDIRIYAAERPDEKLTRKMQIISMGIRVIQGANSPVIQKSIATSIPLTTDSSAELKTTRSPESKSRVEKSADPKNENEIEAEDDSTIPHAVVEKQFLLSDGRVRLEASLDRANYCHGDEITIHVNVTNNSSKSVKRIEADIVQYVDVCMFSNGKFKNVVAQISSRDGCPVEPGFSLARSFLLKPEKSSTKNWIALEDEPGNSKTNGNLASTVVCSGKSPEDRNVFAIYVSYYVKVKIVVSPMGEWIGGVMSVKLPFTLLHNNCDETELFGRFSPPHTPTRILDKIETLDDPSEDSLPFIDKDNTSDEDQTDSPGDKDEIALDQPRDPSELTISRCSAVVEEEPPTSSPSIIPTTTSTSINPITTPRTISSTTSTSTATTTLQKLTSIDTKLSHQSIQSTSAQSPRSTRAARRESLARAELIEQLRDSAEELHKHQQQQQQQQRMLQAGS